MRAAPVARVLAFGVLADDDPVDVLPGAQRTRHAWQHAGRTDVRVLIEALADGEPQTPE